MTTCTLIYPAYPVEPAFCLTRREGDEDLPLCRDVTAQLRFGDNP
jgi:hypothetical protein